MKILTKITTIILCGFNITFGAQQNDIHIAFVCDQNYPMPMCVTMASIIDKAEPGERIHFHVIDLGIKQIDKDRIKALNAKNRFDLDYTYIDKSQFSQFQGYCWSNAIYAKLHLATLLPQLNKCILMDADMIAARSLNELYSLDLKDNYIGIMNNYSFTNYHYCKWLERDNAGTILMNLALMRNTNFGERAIYCLKKGQQNLDRLFVRNGIKKTFTEEPVFQYVCANKILYLPPRFNFLNYMIFPTYNGEISPELVAANNDDPHAQYLLNELKNVVIYHYSDIPKVWNRSEGDWYYHQLSKYMRDLWYYYYAQTEYAGKSM